MLNWGQSFKGYFVYFGFVTVTFEQKFGSLWLLAKYLKKSVRQIKHLKHVYDKFVFYVIFHSKSKVISFTGFPKLGRKSVLNQFPSLAAAGIKWTNMFSNDSPLSGTDLPWTSLAENIRGIKHPDLPFKSSVF